MWAMECNPEYTCPPHIATIDDALGDIMAGQCKRLIITMPPRHGKSEMVSKYFPGFFLGHNPDKFVGLGAYQANFAALWGGRARDVFNEHGPKVFGRNVHRGEGAARNEWFVNGYKGGMYTAGIGGPFTGRGFHIGIIDDPIKNAKDASSAVIRESIWDWYIRTFRTRLEPGGAIIVIMTRWHEDDLVGRLLNPPEGFEKETWRLINMPALAEENDPLNRMPEDALWPERWPAEVLIQTRKASGIYAFSSLYQQRPRPDEGKFFKKSFFKYFDEDDESFIMREPNGVPEKVNKKECFWFQCADTAYEAQEENDFTVIGTFILTPTGRILIYDVFRRRVGVPDQWPAIKAERLKYPHVSLSAVEKKGSGIGIMQTAKREGFPLRALEADRKKELRAQPAVVMYENGLIFHRSGQSWSGNLEAELMDFNKGRFDDQVDVVAYAAILAAEISARPAYPPKYPEKEKDKDRISKTDRFGKDNGHSGRFSGMLVSKPPGR